MIGGLPGGAPRLRRLLPLATNLSWHDAHPCANRTQRSIALARAFHRKESAAKLPTNPLYGLTSHTAISNARRSAIPHIIRRSRWWGAKSSDFPDSAGPSDADYAREEVLSRALKNKQNTGLLLRCTILDKAGNISTSSGEFKKSDLTTQHSLLARDLRKVDSRIPNTLPTILVRKEAILVNMLHIRALVKADSVVLFDTIGSTDTQLHSVFLYHLEHNLKQKSASLPYEFRAMDSILLSVSSALESELVVIRHLVRSLLSELEDDINRDRFKQLLYYSRRLSGFQSRAKLVQEAIEEVLENDDELDGMYLTEKQQARSVKNDEHRDEGEALLESYGKQVEEIANEVETMSSNMQSTREIVELILDFNRNTLLALDLRISIVTMGLGVGALVVGAFGMNLQNHVEQSGVAFFAVTGCLAFVVVAMVGTGLRRLAKLRRVGIGGPHGGRKREKALDPRMQHLRGVQNWHWRTWNR